MFCTAQVAAFFLLIMALGKQGIQQKLPSLRGSDVFFYYYSFLDFSYRINGTGSLKTRSMYRVFQKTWEFSDEFDIVFVMN